MAVYVGETTVKAAPQKVWAVIGEAGNLGKWLSPITHVERSTPGPFRAGSEVRAQIGNLGGGKLKFTKVEPNRTLRWKAGPPIAHLMMMPMRVSVEIEPAAGEGSRVRARFVSPMMISPMMRAMTGLDFNEEAQRTVQQIKGLAEA